MEHEEKLVVGHGWKVKKRKYDCVSDESKSDVCQVCGCLDVTIENPAYSKLWALECVKEMVSKRILNVEQTSYCKYDKPYSKPTKIAHTFGSDLNLPATCSKMNPCFAKRRGRRHLKSLTDFPDKGARNSLPIGLTQDMFGAFSNRALRASFYALMVVDAFCGWGSVASTIPCEVGGRPVFVYTNDICRQRDCNLDVDVDRFGIWFILGMGFIKMVEWLDKHELMSARLLGSKLRSDSSSQSINNFDNVLDTLLYNGVHVWIHISFPCTTYSTMGGGTHRQAGSTIPKTTLATKHDRMMKSLSTDIIRMSKYTFRGNCSRRQAVSPG